MNSQFICKCIADTTDGLQEGLSHFSGSSRAALIYAVTPDEPMRVYDPQNLLRGHEPIFEELYLVSSDWRKNSRIAAEVKKFRHLVPEENLELAGLISWGGRSSSVYYQMWFTEHHPNMCSIGPTECWLEHAAWRFAHDVANEEELYTGISGSFLSEYSTHAVRDYVVDQMNVEEILLESDMEDETGNRLYKIVTSVVHCAESNDHGCTLIIDLNDEPLRISGQKLEEPLDLRLSRNLELSKSLAKVDGALHIGADTHLHGFACLLDGRSVPGEDRSRGARYNSALRFTAEHANIFVVVVSSDRPVSVFQEGVEISAQCEWKPDLTCAMPHQTLKEWIETSGS